MFSAAIVWKSWLVTPALLWTALLTSGTAIALAAPKATLAAEIEASEAEVMLGQLDNTMGATDDPAADPMGQVTSVSQLRDVQPTDWAFQALQSLVERYGCIEGYPDRTYRGNRALTRYEFAAGLNACLDRINEFIAVATETLRPEDIAAVRRLQEEFGVELATLRGRVDALEARATELAANQFSTTTKLSGLVSINLTTAQAAGDDVKVEGFSGPPPMAMRGPDGRPLVRREEDANTTLSYVTWLTLNTSFTGKDRLVTKLVVGNGNSPLNQFISAGNFNTAGVPFFDRTEGVEPNDVVIGELYYSFPVTDSLRVTVGPRINWFFYFDFNPYTLPFTGAATFNSVNSTFVTSAKRGSGAIVEWNITRQLEFRVGYLVESTEFLPGVRAAADPNRGLFNGEDTITAELTLKPTPTSNIRLLYQRSNLEPDPFNPLGQISMKPIVGVADDAFGGPLNSATADTFGVNFDWLITRGFAVFGRYYYMNTHIDPELAGRPEGDIKAQNIQAGLAFPDLGKRGALGTVSFVVPFDVLEGRKFLVAGGGNGGTQYDLEVSYFFPVTPNIAIVPSLYTIFNINNFDDNPTVFVGTLRTQFLF